MSGDVDAKLFVFELLRQRHALFSRLITYLAADPLFNLSQFATDYSFEVSAADIEVLPPARVVEDGLVTYGADLNGKIAYLQPNSQLTVRTPSFVEPVIRKNKIGSLRGSEYPLVHIVGRGLEESWLINDLTTTFR